MNTKTLSMPEHVAALLALTLVRLGLPSPDTSEDAVSVPLKYEDGTELSVLILCVAQHRWLRRERPMILLSVAELDSTTRAVQVFARELMPLPQGPDDFPFMVRLAAKIRAIAWSIAATSGFGECVSLPGRPDGPS